MLTAADLRGVIPALVTPFTSDGTAVDYRALEALVGQQIDAGVAALIPCATTGESPTLSDAEKVSVIRRTVELAAGRVPVIAGTGTFSTSKTIEGAQAALQAGATGIMMVMPYYNRPSQAGLVEHVTAVAAAVRAPVVLYNIPGRTGVDLGPEATVAICERSPNVVGIKDATGNVLRCQELVRRLGGRLAVFSGDDALTLPMLACGARGVISTTANLFPKQVVAVCARAQSGDWEGARQAHLALLPVFDAMFCEPNPGPLKFALSHFGRMEQTVRLPLVSPSEPSRQRILEAVTRYQQTEGAR
jgi:4-hydroxy-tetrahydrodipicolinate synthase